jgi:hypothetical protein
MATLTHADDKQFPQLQTADLLANVARNRLVEWLNDPHKAVFSADAAVRDRLRRLSVQKIGVWTREYMTIVLKSEIERRGLNGSKQNYGHDG